ncbi:MAG TPA: 50S ribosomal protein L17 [Candidatus Bathyarchaeia archaeon]|nr:50S ribosomal protein L17 [Candidatus Bathyarchaeia archaeon]
MRHHYQKKKLNRNTGQRQALFKNLIKSLIVHEEIKTTESKAKVVRRIFEKLVTKGKERTIHARRLIHAFLQNKKAVGKLVDKLAPLFKGRKGGFTRIVRVGERKGDRAMMVKLELIARTQENTKEKEKKKKGKPDKKTAIKKNKVNKGEKPEK